MSEYKISINDHHMDCINIILRPEDLCCLFCYSVSTGLSLFVGTCFHQFGIYVDKEYIERIREVFDDLSITPDFMLNKEYYNR